MQRPILLALLLALAMGVQEGSAATLLADRVRETTTSTGTGTINLDGAVSNYRTFVAGIGTGNATYFCIVHRTATEWECSIGTVTDATPDTLSRTTLLSSSTGSAVSFSAGTKDVFSYIPAGAEPCSQMPALTGDVTSSAGACATTMKNTGTAGTYDSVTTDTQGRVTAGTNLTPTTWGVVAADVTHAQSNTTLSSITGAICTCSTSATEIWQWDFKGMLSTNTTADAKFGMTVPASATMLWGGTSSRVANSDIFGTTPAATADTAMLTESSVQTFEGNAGTLGLSFAGWLFCGGSAGNFQFQFAQNTSNASDTIIRKGSVMICRKVVS